ncbi:MAG: ABC transporter ATP-binding protein [Bacteroidales bacterium]|jgi:ABC-2 type transport system ATP-binding protein|nr:ABC transporter ATP-binding protein [Bacteroidales bacterium]
MIEAEGIRKHFGSHQALKGVSFRVEDGQIVALMGANGAGKSTLFDILATIDSDFEGRALVDGFDVRTHPKDARARIGYVPGRFSLYGDLSVTENLEFFAGAYGCRAEDIETLSPCLWKSLGDFTHFRADTLSGGMKQKLAICCALVHNPSMLLLDEPTVGVDPVSRYDMWKEIGTLRDKGVSVLVSTHYLDEAGLADRILFLHEGETLLFDSPEHIIRSYPHRLYSLPCSPAELPQFEAALNAEPGVLDHYLWGDSLHFTADASYAGTPLCGRKPSPVEPGIEDIFIDTLSSGRKRL